MIDTGYIHPMLVVGLDGQCDPFAGSMYTNSVLYGNYEDYIMQEAIPFAESLLRTKNSPNYRCIMGFAMGGYGSMKFAIKYYEQFAGVASYNGPLQFDTTMVLWLPEVILENPGPPHHYQYTAGVFTGLLFTGAGGFSPNLNILPYQVEFPYDTMGIIVDSVKKKWKEYDCSRLVKGLDTVPYHPGLFIGCGINDFLYFHPTNVCFVDTLDELGLKYEFLTTDDGHVLSDEILAAGMYFLDSVMHDDFWIGNNEYLVQETNALTVYPNPCSSVAHLRYLIHDIRYLICDLYRIDGVRIERLIEEEKMPGEYELEIDVSGLPAGLYFISLQVGNKSKVGKILIVH